MGGVVTLGDKIYDQDGGRMLRYLDWPLSRVCSHMIRGGGHMIWGSKYTCHISLLPSLPLPTPLLPPSLPPTSSLSPFYRSIGALTYAL